MPDKGSGGGDSLLISLQPFLLTLPHSNSSPIPTLCQPNANAAVKTEKQNRFEDLKQNVPPAYYPMAKE